MNRLFLQKPSLFAPLGGIMVARRSDSPMASEWRHGARIHPDDGFADAQFTVAPATRPVATVATPLASQSRVIIVGSSRSVEQSALERPPGTAAASGLQAQALSHPGG